MERLSWPVLLTLSMAGIAAFFPITKSLEGAVDPLLLTFFRFAVASLALLPVVLHTRSFTIPSRRDLITFILVAVGGTIPTALVVIGISSTNSIVAAILTNTNPLIVALFAPFLLGEDITSRKVFGLLLGFLGVAAVVLNGQNPLQHLDIVYLGGALILLIAALFSALNKIYSRDLVRKYDGLYVTFLVVSLGSMMLGAVIGFQGSFAQVLEFTPTTFLLLFTIGVLCTAVPWTVWTSSLKHLDVHVAASFNLLIPVFAALYSLLFLEENLTSWILIGLILVSVGIYIVQREGKVVQAV